MSICRNLITLADLARGQDATVAELCGSAEECARMTSLGFCCGSRVRMLTPGLPCALIVDEARVVLCDGQDLVRVALAAT